MAENPILDKQAARSRQAPVQNGVAMPGPDDLPTGGPREEHEYGVDLSGIEVRQDGHAFSVGMEMGVFSSGIVESRGGIVGAFDVPVGDDLQWMGAQGDAGVDGSRQLRPGNDAMDGLDSDARDLFNDGQHPDNREGMDSMQGLADGSQAEAVLVDAEMFYQRAFAELYALEHGIEPSPGAHGAVEGTHDAGLSDRTIAY